MEDHKPPLFTDHRRRRCILWALTLLGWLTAVLYGDREVSFRQAIQRVHHVWLDRVVAKTIALLIGRALQFANLRTRRRAIPWKHGRSLRRAHFIRSLLGARLRRLLLDKDHATQIAKLVAVLRNLDAHARRLAHRLRHNLTRLWRQVPPIAPAETLTAAPLCTPALADSS